MIVIAVPRSGSASTSTQKSVESMPIGFQSSRRVSGGRRRVRYDAAQIASASFASSDGWKTIGPKVSHRRAPFTAWPSTSTASRRTKLVTTSGGARLRRTR